MKKKEKNKLVFRETIAEDQLFYNEIMLNSLHYLLYLPRSNSIGPSINCNSLPPLPVNTISPRSPLKS